jgi:hypothetical protein
MATVFLCWSGPESKHYAIEWRKWTNEVFKGARAFISDRDIQAGDDWRRKISSQIRKSKVGIVFLTKTNRSAPWLLFEAGALAIAKRRRLVVYVVPGGPRRLPSPLDAFQAVRADKVGARKLFRVLRDEVGTPRAKFSLLWPRLNERLRRR